MNRIPISTRSVLPTNQYSRSKEQGIGLSVSRISQTVNTKTLSIGYMWSLCAPVSAFTGSLLDSTASAMHCSTLDAYGSAKNSGPSPQASLQCIRRLLVLATWLSPTELETYCQQYQLGFVEVQVRGGDNEHFPTHSTAPAFAPRAICTTDLFCPVVARLEDSNRSCTVARRYYSLLEIDSACPVPTNSSILRVDIVLRLPFRPAA